MKKSKKLDAQELLRVLKKTAPEIKQSRKVLIPALARAGVTNPLVLTGPQQLRIKRTIQWIKGAYFEGDKTSISTYFPEDLSSQSGAAKVVSALTTLSLFSSVQLIILYDADKIKAAPARSIAEALARCGETAFVILTAENAGPKSPLFNALDAGETVVQFGDLSPELLKKWIEKEAQDGEIEGIEPDALELLIKCYSCDLSALAREISKLALLTPRGGRITKKLVQTISLRSPEAGTFALASAMARKDVLGAARLVEELVDQGLHPLQISAFLNRCFRTLLAHLGPHSSDSSELQNQWFLRNLSDARRHFTPADIQASLELLKQLDFQLKDSALPDSLTLPITVQRITKRAW